MQINKKQCVDENIECWDDALLLSAVKGEIYTVEYASSDEHGVWIGLIELPMEEYQIFHFRPLVTKTLEQDLAIFLPLLTDLRVGTDA